MKSSFRFAGIVTSLAFALAACAQTAPPPSQTGIQSVTITPATTTVAVGSSVTLTATAVRASGDTTSSTGVTWSWTPTTLPAGVTVTPGTGANANSVTVTTSATAAVGAAVNLTATSAANKVGSTTKATATRTITVSAGSTGGTGTVVYRVDVGSTTPITTTTPPWAADNQTGGDITCVGGADTTEFFFGGATVSVPAGLANAAPAAVYSSEMACVSGNTLTVSKGSLAAGTYTVRLHFSENYGEVNAADERRLSVAINGGTPSASFSVWDDAAAGTAGANNTAVIKEYTVTLATTGTITVGITASGTVTTGGGATSPADPFLNGIEIVKTS